MRITFTEDAVYETDGYNKGKKFKKGSTHDLRDDLAQRWLRRGVAVEAKKGDGRPSAAAPRDRAPARRTAKPKAASPAKDKAAAPARAKASAKPASAPVKAAGKEDTASGGDPA